VSGCSTQPERRRRKFRPETLRHKNGRRRNEIPRGFWRAVDCTDPPTEGERRKGA
jgi:hypothetical protein